MKYTELCADPSKKYRVLDLQTGDWVKLPLDQTHLADGVLFPDLTTRPATRTELDKFHTYWVSDFEDRYEFIEWEKQ